MKNSHTSNILTILLLVLMCGGIMVSVFFYSKLQKTSYDLTIARDSLLLIEAQAILLSDANKQYKAMTDSLSAFASLQGNKDSVSQGKPPAYTASNGHKMPVQGKPSVSAKKLSDLLARAQTIDKSVYEVAVYSYKCPARNLQQAVSYFTNNGYRMPDTASLDIKPSWFASTPTVFYYDKDNEIKARTFAAGLNQVTGLQFAAVRGAGFGVPKEVQPYTFKIHLVARE